MMSRRKQKFPLHLRSGDDSLGTVAADFVKRKSSIKLTSDCSLNSGIARKLRPTNSSYTRTRTRILITMKDTTFSPSDSDGGNRLRNVRSKSFQKRRQLTRQQRLRAFQNDVNLKAESKRALSNGDERCSKENHRLSVEISKNESVEMRVVSSNLTHVAAVNNKSIESSGTMDKKAVSTSKSCKVPLRVDQNSPCIAIQNLSPTMPNAKSVASYPEDTTFSLSESQKENASVLNSETMSSVKTSTASTSCIINEARTFDTTSVNTSGVHFPAGVKRILASVATAEPGRSVGREDLMEGLFGVSVSRVSSGVADEPILVKIPSSDLTGSEQPLDLSVRRNSSVKKQKLAVGQLPGLLSSPCLSAHNSGPFSPAQSMCSPQLLEAVRDAKQVTCNTGSLSCVVKSSESDVQAKRLRLHTPTMAAFSSVPFLLPIATSSSRFVDSVAPMLEILTSKTSDSTVPLSTESKYFSMGSKPLRVINSTGAHEVVKEDFEIEKMDGHATRIDESTRTGQEYFKLISSADGFTTAKKGDETREVLLNGSNSRVSIQRSPISSCSGNSVASLSPIAVSNSQSGFPRSQKSPMDVERQNLENELREFEAKVFNYEQARLYLGVDSSALEMCAKLPLFGTEKEKKIFTVKDRGADDVLTTVTVHSEQVLSSRLLCIDHTTGCRRELYLCYLCNCAFSSATDLHHHVDQDHVTHYTCTLCGFTTHAPTLFSLHVHQQHIAPAKIHLNSLCQPCSLPTTSSPSSKENLQLSIDVTDKLSDSQCTDPMNYNSSSVCHRVDDAIHSPSQLSSQKLSSSISTHCASQKLLQSSGPLITDSTFNRYENTLISVRDSPNVDKGNEQSFSSPCVSRQSIERVGSPPNSCVHNATQATTLKRTHSGSFNALGQNGGNGYSFTDHCNSNSEKSSQEIDKSLPLNGYKNSLKSDRRDTRSPFLLQEDDSDVTVAQMLTALRRGSLTRPYTSENFVNDSSGSVLVRNDMVSRPSSPATQLQNFDRFSSIVSENQISKTLVGSASPQQVLLNSFDVEQNGDPILLSPRSLDPTSLCVERALDSQNQTNSSYNLVSCVDGPGVLRIKSEFQDVCASQDVLRLREENVISGLVKGVDVANSLNNFPGLASLSKGDSSSISRSHVTNYPKIKLKNGPLTVNMKEKSALDGENVFKMYQCKYCEKKFDRAFSCNRHERVHTGYKPCYCKHCGKGFSEPRNLRHHMIRFHSDGSMKHLIRRDRRRRLSGEYGVLPLSKSVNVLYSAGVFSNPMATNISLKNNIADSLAMKAFSDTNLKNLLQFIEPLQQTSLRVADTTNGNGTDIKIQPSVQSILEGSLDVKPQPHLFNKSGVDLILNHHLPFTTLLPDVSTSPVDLTQVPSFIESEADVKRAFPSDNTTMRNAYSEVNGSAFLSLAENSEENSIAPFDTKLAETNENTKTSQENLEVCIVDSGSPYEEKRECNGISTSVIQQSPVSHSQKSPSSSAIDSNSVNTHSRDDTSESQAVAPQCSEALHMDIAAKVTAASIAAADSVALHNCHSCGYSARSASQLRVHELRHKGVKEHSCAVCNYSGVTLSDLTRHRKTNSHILRSANICTCCGLGFPAPDQLQVHVLKQHPELEGATSLLQMSLGQ